MLNAAILYRWRRRRRKKRRKRMRKERRRRRREMRRLRQTVSLDKGMTYPVDEFLKS